MGKDSSFKWLKTKITDLRLKPLDVLIIGGTGGLGRAIAQSLSFIGAEVTVVGRTFRDNDTNIKFVEADLSSIERSQIVAKQLDVSKTDMIIFTTGIFANPKREETKEGLERDMAVSYLNRLAMLRILAPRLKSSKNFPSHLPRVFIMGYPGNNQIGQIDDLNSVVNYKAISAHLNTVAGNEALVFDGKNSYKNVNFYGLNPGLVVTDIRNNYFGKGTWTSLIVESIIGLFSPTPAEFSKKLVPLLVAPELDCRNGGIFDKNGDALFPSRGLTSEYAARYIKASEDLLSSKGFDVQDRSA